MPRGEGHPVGWWPTGLWARGWKAKGGGLRLGYFASGASPCPGGPCPGAGFGTYELPAPKEEGGGRSVGELAPGRLWHPRAVHPEGVPQPGGRCQWLPALRDIGTPPGSVHDQGWVGAQGASAHGVEIRALGRGFRRPDEHHSIQRGKECWKSCLELLLPSVCKALVDDPSNGRAFRLDAL